MYLFQSLLPAVRVLTEGALKLLGNISGHRGSASPVHIPLTHLLFQVLLQAGFVCKLSGTVWALERPISTIMRRLKVIVEKSLLRKIFITVMADKWPFPRVHPVVHV